MLPILLLGYPIYRAAPQELEGILENCIKQYETTNTPCFATTSNAYIISQLSTVNLNRHTNPEVVKTLRQTDFIGLDSPFLKTLSLFLGNEVKDLIAPIDLLRAAASLLSKTEKSLFLIGKKEEIAKQITAKLQEAYPNLKIAGTSCPSIYTKGKALETTLEKNPYIVDMINRAKPTVLIIELGHPKQELWFESIKQDLKVPLCIGFSRGYESFLSKKESAPTWQWQKIGGKIGPLCRFACALVPLFFFHSINCLITNIASKFRQPEGMKKYLFLSTKTSLITIRFSSILNHTSENFTLQWLETAIEHDHLLVDLAHVRHIDLVGLGLLYFIWKKARASNKNLFILGVSKDMKWLMKLHGAWDLLCHHICASPEEVLDRMSINLKTVVNGEGEFTTIDQHEKQITLTIFGKLQGSSFSHSLKPLIPLLENHECILDLTYATSITIQGFSFLFKLKEWTEQKNQKLKIIHIPKSIRNQLKCFKLQQVF